MAEESKVIESYNKNMEFLKKIGFIPVGSGGVWSNGTDKIVVDFVVNSIIIKKINE
jgi:hypothetical protein